LDYRKEFSYEKLDSRPKNSLDLGGGGYCHSVNHCGNLAYATTQGPANAGGRLEAGERLGWQMTFFFADAGLMLDKHER